MADCKKYNGSTWEHSLRKLGTDTDTLTTLPADLYADGNNATVGLKGNMSQIGTPSPDNPIQPSECGERTGNLFDGNYTIAVMSVSGNTATLNTTSSGRTAIVKCEPNTTYTVKKYSASNRFIIAESDIKPANVTAMSIIQNNSSISEYTFTTSNTTQYVAVYCSTSSEQAEPQLMFNLGATAFPYENFGYKIPISSANATTPVYLGEVETTRKIKMLVLTGTNADGEWKKSSTRTGSFYLNIGTNATVALGLCDRAVNVGTIEQYNSIGKMFVESSGSSKLINLWLFDTNISLDDFKAYLAAQYAAGTPVTVWYVLATEETGIVNEPLRKIGNYADTLSGITIPTIAGGDTLSVGTTVQPSEVTVNYKGWHPVQNVHECDNGAWT